MPELPNCYNIYVEYENGFEITVFDRSMVQYTEETTVPPYVHYMKTPFFN